MCFSIVIRVVPLVSSFFIRWMRCRPATVAVEQEEELRVLREILRQADVTIERFLSERQSALRGARDLLRLVVASLAGVVVLGVALVTVGIRVPTVALAMGLMGVLMLMGAGLALASVLAGMGAQAVMGFGPNPHRLVSRMVQAPLQELTLLNSLARGAPGIAESVARGLRSVRGAITGGLLLLALGTFLVMAGILYVLGGLILD
jgi:hypothetical protein